LGFNNGGRKKGAGRRKKGAGYTDLVPLPGEPAPTAASGGKGWVN